MTADAGAGDEGGVVERLSSYLSGRLADGEVVVSDLTRHSEGWSRRTLSFRASWDGGRESRRLVARVESDPGAELSYDTRNDLETEFMTMEAARDADVPVPETYWYESDEAVLGGPFFLVEHRPGDAPITWNPRDRAELYEAWDDPDRTLPHQFVDAAAGIHSIDESDVPFLEPTRPEEFVADELETYRTIYEETALKEEPAVAETLRWLRENEPDVPETTLVHGDFRVGNTLIDDRELTAVLDWEFARLGDPLYDLGYASTRYFAGKLVEPIERPELACALLEREWFYDRYEERTGRRVDRERVRYWQVFSAFTMLTRGVVGSYRFHAGETDDVRNAWLQYIVPGHIEDLLEIVREDRT